MSYECLIAIICHPERSVSGVKDLLDASCLSMTSVLLAFSPFL